MIAFAHDEEDDALGEAKTRDPEHTPFDNAFLNEFSHLGPIADALSSRNAMYAVKAGVLGALTTLPNFIAYVHILQDDADDPIVLRPHFTTIIAVFGLLLCK